MGEPSESNYTREATRHCCTRSTKAVCRTPVHIRVHAVDDCGAFR